MRSICCAAIALLYPLTLGAQDFPRLSTPLVELEDSKIPLGMERCGKYFAGDRQRNATRIKFAYRIDGDFVDDSRPATQIIVRLPREGEEPPQVPMVRAEGNSIVLEIALADYVTAPCLPPDYG